MPVSLYHGTRGHILESVLSKGLRPRGLESVGNWPEMPSRSDRVYFTNFVQLAYSALDTQKGPGWVFQVDVPDANISADGWGPDEDSIGSVIGRKEGWWNPAALTDDMLLRMKALIATINVADYAEEWADYLERSGAISVVGDVPVSYITAYTRVEVHSIPEVRAILKDFGERPLPADRATMTVHPESKAMVRAVYASFTKAVMTGMLFDRIDDLYPIDMTGRKKRIAAFERQMANGFRTTQCSRHDRIEAVER